MSERCLLLIGNRAGLVCGGPLNLADSRASSGQRASRWTRRARRFPTRGRKTLMRAIAAPTIARELTLQYAVLMLPTERSLSFHLGWHCHLPRRTFLPSVLVWTLSRPKNVS